MAIIGEKLTKFLVSKFNEEYQATHQFTEFILTQIPLNEDHQFAFEATANLYNAVIRFRVYFNINQATSLLTFKLNSLDDIIPTEDYCFTTKGTISADVLTDNGNYKEIKLYRGTGHIDPTNVCVSIRMMLGLEEW